MWVGRETAAQTGDPDSPFRSAAVGQEARRFLESVGAAGELQPQLGNTNELA